MEQQENVHPQEKCFGLRNRYMEQVDTQIQHKLNR